jgi:hypothetical protein
MKSRAAKHKNLIGNRINGSFTVAIKPGKQRDARTPAIQNGAFPILSILFIRSRSSGAGELGILHPRSRQPSLGETQVQTGSPHLGPRGPSGVRWPHRRGMFTVPSTLASAAAGNQLNCPSTECCSGAGPSQR